MYPEWGSAPTPAGDQSPDPVMYNKRDADTAIGVLCLLTDSFSASFSIRRSDLSEAATRRVLRMLGEVRQPSPEGNASGGSALFSCQGSKSASCLRPSAEIACPNTSLRPRRACRRTPAPESRMPSVPVSLSAKGAENEKSCTFQCNFCFFNDNITVFWR